MTKILVTSALPYANGSIHIGHLVEYIQTDIFVRFLKLRGEDVIYCCADDAHGTPIEVNAKKLGVTPKELIDRFYKEHLEDFGSFFVHFDSYHTTDSPENKKFSDLIFSRLKEKGLIEKKTITQMYCDKDKRFLPDRFIKGKCPKCGAEDQYGDVCENCGRVLKTTELINPRCVVCGSTPVSKSSEHYFFQLAKCEQKLRAWLNDNKLLQPDVKNYVMNWIDEGLEDWDISRDGPYFGFLIPGETDKYYYVWLDAPIGYIASTEHYCSQHERRVEDYWKGQDSRIIHFIGKDIVYFHFLFWPAMLMESGFKVPDDIVVHGFLTVGREKMSKSRGTFYTARDFLKLYNPEYLRYYYACLLSKKTDDIDLDFADLADRVNNELVANLGNFCYRVLSFVNNNFDSKIGLSQLNEKIVAEVEKKSKTIEKSYESYDFKTATKEILAVSAVGNKFFQDKEPWKLVKEDKAAAEQVLGLCLAITENLAILAKPILPRFSQELEHQLGLGMLSWKDLGFKKQIYKIRESKPLIQKVEKEQKKELFPLDLRVARIVGVEDHPQADKLIVMQIDLGAEQRQIVAGIKKYYSKEELVGKNIVVVANLKPATLRGAESKGMLLAAEDGKGGVKLVLAEKSKPGEQLGAGGLEIGTSEITIEEFSKVGLAAKSGLLAYRGKPLFANGVGATVDVADGAVIR